jgi:hypothetical protein
MARRELRVRRLRRVRSVEPEPEPWENSAADPF